MYDFKGKVVVVTGGSMGIGRATSIAFAKAGAKVVVADIDEEKGKETIRIVKDLGHEALFVKTDVSKGDEVKAMVQFACDNYGGLDIACNNAGVSGSFTALDSYTEEAWDNVVNTNLKGVWLCMKHQIPEMLKRGGGAIVNVASSFGLVAAPEHYGYVASKHGVIGITKCAALEFIKNNIRVNCICPGGTDTPMIQECYELNPEIITPIINQHPIKRLAKSEEQANAILWLCSEKASFVVGSVLRVDGGLLAK